MKTLLVAIAFGLFGAIAVSISFALHWPTWVMFIAWVSFYIFGKRWQTSAEAFLQMVLGMTMAALIQLTAGALTKLVGAIGFPLSVFFYIGSLAYLGKIKYLSNIPAWFLGLIIFFGAHPALEVKAVLQLLIPIVAGFVFAWANNLVVEKLHGTSSPLKQN